jgi:hypothetical protein
MAEGRDDAGLEELDIALGMAADPAGDAMAALRAHQEAAGLRFADPDAPVAAPDREDIPGWMTQDEEFS